MQTPKGLEQGHAFCGRGLFSYKTTLGELLGLGRELVFGHGATGNCKTAVAPHGLGVTKSKACTYLLCMMDVGICCGS